MKWRKINSAERPIENTVMLVLSNRHVRAGYIHKGKWYKALNSRFTDELINVTHWMYLNDIPLPEDDDNKCPISCGCDNRLPEQPED